MSTTTLRIRAVPESYVSMEVRQRTVSFFDYSPWVVVAPTTNDDMYILAIDYTCSTVLTANSTHEQIFEIGFGQPGYEVIRVQVPYSMRCETSVGHYLNTRIFLPEPVFVPKGTIVSVRVADNRSGIDIYNGVRFLAMVDRLPVQQSEQIKIENQHSVRAGTGISVSERGGVFR